MLIKYYNNDELKYATRKRYRNFSFEPFAQETQKSIVLGDGANTQVKTSKANLCNYVKIDDTRWFVTSYTYMNGGQITLNLQRDVIGEMGIADCFGKVERGYTESFLRNRKELSLNEILKDRKKLIPNTNTYGNYTVDNHTNELWGVMYFAKPTGLNLLVDPPAPYPPQLTINIPAFAPNYVNYPVLPNGQTRIIGYTPEVVQNFYFTIKASNPDGYAQHCFQLNIEYKYINNVWTYTKFIGGLGVLPQDETVYIHINSSVDPMIVSVPDFMTCYSFVDQLADVIAQDNISTGNSGIVLPSIPTVDVETYDYTGLVVKEDTSFYSYTSALSYPRTYGQVSLTNVEYYLTHIPPRIFTLLVPNAGSGSLFSFSVQTAIVGINTEISQNSAIKQHKKTYTRTLLSNNDSGNVVIDTTQQLVDEPYSILAFPLFNVTITGDTTYNITKQEAFMVFNTVIQYLSGENPYLIDAQIYPYCPILTGVASAINGYPFFKIASNTYIRNCAVQLLPSSDIKKEYIQRKYSIISPEQTGKFDFNFYDYVTEVINDNGKNTAFLNILIKTSLKPFSIISSAVINPSLDSLKGISYGSDLRGSQPTSNGFECSLSSNAFETYKRQNSNYQQIFNLQKEELALQHKTEQVNEITSGVVNTVSATAMGAIAGGAIGGGIGIGAGVGAGIGGAIAGGTVGAASIVQYNQNEKLRDFEKNLQQQSFDLQIGTVKALPNSINRISSFNEIILQDFWYVIEVYECSDYEKELVNTFITSYGYGIGVFSFISNFYKNNWFLRSTLVSSKFPPNLHNIASNELMGGIYYNE